MDEEGDIADGPNGPIVFQGGRWVPMGGPAARPAQPQGIQVRPAKPAPTPAPPSGYRPTQGGGLEPIPGGPADQPKKTEVDQTRRVGRLDSIAQQIDRVQGLYKGKLADRDGLSSLLQYFPFLDADSEQFNAAGAGVSDQGRGLFRTPGEGSQSDIEFLAFVEANQPRASDRDATIEEKLRNVRGRIDAERAAAGLPAWNWQMGPPADGSTEMSVQQGRRARPDEDVQFAGDAETPRGVRFTPDQEAQVVAAMRSGDVGQAVALIGQFNGGKPVDRAAIANAVAELRKNPNAPVALNYGAADEEAQSQYERERYGEYLQPAIDDRSQRGGSSVDSFVRQTANSGTLGLADVGQAGFDTLFNGEGFTDNLQRQRAMTEADFRENPAAAFGGTIAGSLVLPTRGMASGAAARTGAAASGLGAREAAVIGRQAAGRRFAAEGAGYGGAQGVIENIEDPVRAAKRGAGGAAAGGTLGYGLGRSIGAAVRPEAQTLIDEGIRPTFGQMTGGAIAQLEDNVARIPLAGANTARAQQRAVIDLNRAQINRSLRPIGEELPRNVAVGTNAVDYATQRIGKVYDAELPNIAGQIPAALPKRFAALQRRARIPAGTDGERNVRAAIEEAMRPFNRTGAFTGRGWKDADETLNGLSVSWSKSEDPYVRKSGDVARSLRDQLRRVVYNQNPQAATRLRQADRGFASLIRTQAASAAADKTGGVFTAAQLSQAVKGADRTGRRSATARGRALDQDLSSAAAMALRNAPAQGGRWGDMNGLLAAGALTGHAFTGNPIALGVGGAFATNSLMYSRAGQALLRQGLSGSSVQRGLRDSAGQAGQPMIEEIEGYFQEDEPVTTVRVGRR